MLASEVAQALPEATHGSGFNERQARELVPLRDNPDALQEAMVKGWRLQWPAEWRPPPAARVRTAAAASSATPAASSFACSALVRRSRREHGSRRGMSAFGPPRRAGRERGPRRRWPGICLRDCRRIVLGQEAKVLYEKDSLVLEINAE
jgi:hypothetical protein